MIPQTEIERYLDDWLGNAPMGRADRVVVAVAVRISREKQRPAPRLAWAIADLFSVERLLTAAAAAVVVALAGLTVFRTPLPPGNVPTLPSGGPPTAAPTESLFPSPTAPPPLPQAVYSGDLPAGWTVVANEMLEFVRENGSMTIELLPNRSVAAANCAFEPEPGIGKSADDFIDAIAARPGLMVSLDVPIEVDGLPGRQIDIRVDPATEAPCTGEGFRYVPLFGTRDGFFPWNHMGVLAAERVRLIVLDVPGGQNILINIVASDSAAFEQYSDDATTIVNRLGFAFD